jgi:hypothetical protein
MLSWTGEDEASKIYQHRLASCLCIQASALLCSFRIGLLPLTGPQGGASLASVCPHIHTTRNRGTKSCSDDESHSTETSVWRDP